MNNAFFQRHSAALQNFNDLLATLEQQQVGLTTKEAKIRVLTQKIETGKTTHEEFIKDYQKGLEVHGELLNKSFELEFNKLSCLSQFYLVQAKKAFVLITQMDSNISELEDRLKAWENQLTEAQQDLIASRQRFNSVKNQANQSESSVELTVDTTTNVIGAPPEKCRPYF